MFDKKFFISLTLSLLTVLGLQYFFSGRGDKQQVTEHGGSVDVAQQQTPVAGQPIKVATTQELMRPLNRDIKFAEKQTDEPEILTDVQTKHYKAVFSTNGAVLTSFELTDHKGKSGQPLKTIDAGKTNEAGAVSIEDGCFLVALEDNTPLKYNLISKQDNTVDQKNIVELVYQTETEFWTINKIYTLYQDTYKIDLSVKFEPKRIEGLTPLRARVVICSPRVDEIENDPINAFVFNEAKDSVDKIDLGASQGLGWFAKTDALKVGEPVGKIHLGACQDLAWHWVTPKVMFGSEDKYFAHSMIDDSAKFVQRAYIKKIDSKGVTTIFEGPEITEAKSFNLSFYMGPKTLNAMTSVDSRLVDLLALGWLSWLCKLLLQFIGWLFSLIGNYGWAIVVMTILLRLPFIPLSIYSRKRMEDYQRFQPTIQRIRQKYRHDLRMQNEELMKFHQDHNLSTATPLLGCLPLLIQMPILFALYRVLGNYLDLYQAPFFGWIHDLSAKDPFYVIPVIMGLTMIWQQAMAPSGDEKQKIMMYFVSIVMTVVFAGFPVGLVLYWTMNNILTLMEDYFRKYVLKY